MRPTTTTALALAACLALTHCSHRDALREKRSRDWRATVLCSSAPTEPLRAKLVLRVECFTGGRADVELPGSARTAESREALDALCKSIPVSIQSRETPEGTIFAASISSAAESAVAYRARNSSVFGAPSAVQGEATAALGNATSPIRAALSIIESGALRNTASSPMIDAFDGEAIAEHRATLLRLARQCLVPAPLVVTLVKTSPDEVAAQLFDPAYISGDCTPLQRGLEAAPRDVVGPLAERWVREHAAQPAPWPTALVRYASSHGISLPPQAR